MSLPNLFAVCGPREDVRLGRLTESEFAADLAQVLRGTAPKEYRDPIRFFANTHPTRGLKNLLWNVCSRLAGSGGQVSSIFRLDTNYGGGKTHALIALAHAAAGMAGVPNVAEFLDPGLLPTAEVNVAAFDGEIADPVNGRDLGDGRKVHTPWGEIAYALAGGSGYERVRKSDETGVAPGSETLRELFGDQPTLILIDELSIYLRKIRKSAPLQQAAGQLTAFLNALFKAVESSPRAALVYTLAVGKDGEGRKAGDAFQEENRFIADFMEEAESVSARKATILDPTEEDETVRILRRRLFSDIDDERAAEIIEAYGRLWEAHAEHLPALGADDKRREAFRSGYPLHPELIETLKEKTSTLANFQRVRGMLRLLARTVENLWKERPNDAYAIHLHHVDPGNEHIRQEIVTKLGQKGFVPALKADVAAVAGDQPALADELDAGPFVGLPSYGGYVARTIFFHTLAFNDSLKGLTRKDLRYAILSPGTDISFIDDARQKFAAESAYLDDQETTRLRFSTEANLIHLVRRQMAQIDPNAVREELNSRIREIFRGKAFQLVPFPDIPNVIPDDAGDGKPYLAVVSYDATEVSGDSVAVPPLVRRLYREKSGGGDVRKNRNHLVFAVVDVHKKTDMREAMVEHLALDALQNPDRQRELGESQQRKLKEWFNRSKSKVAVDIQQAYRHVFYPTNDRLDGADVDLGHTVVDVQNASADPGNGQRQIVRLLRQINKLRLPEDEPDNPAFIRDRTPLKKGPVSTGELRNEYRKNPGLPILIGDDVFRKGIRKGIEQGLFVYQSGDLLWGQGAPWAEIKIDENSFVMPAQYARENDIWPPKPKPPESGDGGKGDEEETRPGSGSTGGTEIGRGTGTGGGDVGGGDSDIGGTGSPGGQSKEPQSITEEAVLQEALTKIWETARSRKFGRIGSLYMKLSDAADAFKLLGLVGAVANSEKRVKIEADYETRDGSELNLEFEGRVADAQPVKDFLDPQLRAAAERDIHVEFTIEFTEGLDLSGDEPEKLARRLCRFGAGSVFVRATAKGNR